MARDENDKFPPSKSATPTEVLVPLYPISGGSGADEQPRGGRTERWGSEPPPRPGREVPPQWARLAADGKLPRVVTELLRGRGVSFSGAPGFGVDESAATAEGVEGTFCG